MKKVIAVISITRGSWMKTDMPKWEGLYFEEFLIDWSLFSNCSGKFYVETMHCETLKPPQAGALRLAYQQLPAQMIPIEGSEITTYQKTKSRWQLLESEWFKLPQKRGVSCVWVQGKANPKCEISLALATLVIAEEV